LINVLENPYTDASLRQRKITENAKKCTLRASVKYLPALCIKNPAGAGLFQEVFQVHRTASLWKRKCRRPSRKVSGQTTENEEKTAGSMTN
jgi:hypothetical protein